MKHIKLYLSAAITAGLMLFSACEEDTIDPLGGTYPVPADYALGSILVQDMQKGASTRTFTLELGSSDQYLAIDFVGSRLSYFLTPGVYTIAAEATAKAGNYIAGRTRWVASGASLPLTDGSIFVALAGDVYTITGTVMLEDRSIIRIAFAGAIPFAPDPPAFTYTVEVQKPYAWTADGTAYINVEGSQLNKINVFSEGIPVAYFEIVTGEGASLAGTYPVSGEIRDAGGAVVQGLYMDLSAFVPGLIIEGGSYLLNDNDKQYISAGDITITNNGGALTFTSGNLAIIDKATGGLLPGLSSINYVEATSEGASMSLSNLLSASATDLAAIGAGTGYTVTLKLGEAGVTAETGPYGVTIGGTGKYLSVDFSRDEATLPAGVYNIVDAAAAAVGDAIAGYYLDLGFMAFPTGTYLTTVTAGAEGAPDYITGGTVTVAESGGVYTVTVNAATASGEAVKTTYTGPIIFQ